MADLGHWLSGDYRVAGQDPGADEDADTDARVDPDEADGQQR
jgi:endogenous inhibitor of DNA gyrase (YacG/DUF329 family)